MWIESAVTWFTNAANALVFAQLVAAFVTAVATIALWRVTRVLAVETKTLAASSSRAFVVSSFESSGADPTALNITLRNTGNATAFDVKLNISPALPRYDGQKSEEETQTVFEISLLPPGVVLPFQGVMSRDVPDGFFEIQVSWSQMPGDKNRQQIAYKTEPKDGFRGGWNTKGLHQVAQEIEKLRKAQEKKE